MRVDRKLLEDVGTAVSKFYARARHNQPLTDDDLLAYVMENKLDSESALDASKRLLIEAAMHEAGGIKARAAEFLDISARVMCYYTTKYNGGKR